MGQRWRKKCCNVLTASFFGYETQKVVQINSKKIGFTYRVIQVTILLYFILWVLYHERGYQNFDDAVSGVMIKVKGLVYTNLSHVPGIGDRIWDPADYVVPPQQNAGIFITTNVIVTPKQSQGVCPESPSLLDTQCFNDTDCPEGYSHPQGNGIYTGRCDTDVNRCEIFGWCPTEIEQFPLPQDTPFRSAVNFTLLVKNSIEFPRFGVKRRNILKNMRPTYLKNCHYHPYHPQDKYCPIFRLEEIFRYTQTNVDRLLVYGGSVAISIDWTCDLDYSVEYCLPKYTFSRLDHQLDSEGMGWSFRHAYFYWEEGHLYRTLIRAYGVQFHVLVTGKGGRFSVLNFTMNCGSGLALLGAASLLCDMIILHFLKSKKLYRAAKFDPFLKRRPTTAAALVAAADPSQTEKLLGGVVGVGGSGLPPTVAGAVGGPPETPVKGRLAEIARSLRYADEEGEHLKGFA